MTHESSGDMSYLECQATKWGLVYDLGVQWHSISRVLV